MADFNGSYSRRIAWLKLILPLTALAILSSLFLVSKPPAPPINAGPEDAEDGAPVFTPSITDPSLSGVTENGSRYTLRATLAVPKGDDMDTLNLTNFAGTLISKNGFQVDVFAPFGIVQNQGTKAVLSQGVRLITSDGYNIKTTEMQADLVKTKISTPGAVEATGPLGSVSAGRMILRQQSGSGSESSYELVFKDGVKVLYQPEN